MQVRPFHIIALALAGSGAFALAGPALSQAAGAKTTARYTIDAGTVSGMGAMSAGGGGVGAILGAMRGGAASALHELTLRLGSGTAPAGAPQADHFVPPAAGIGTSVPLVTPRPTPGPDGTPGMPPQAQMPRGRLLLFWGCGEHAPAGQPVVIDFSKLAKGQVPPGLFASGPNLPEDWQITQANSRTYGEWPNDRDHKTVPANGSLLGAHKISSNYAPEIAFNLADDFMPALKLGSQPLASGATMLDWNALPKATGYYAWAMGAQMDGGGQPKDMVWWTSSSSQAFGGALTDWLSPAAVAKLVAARTVLPPTQTTCAVPAEVKQAGGEMLMTQLYAYGPQADFSYPPRPPKAAASWKPDWIARVRFRANTMTMLGMPAMGGFDTSGSEDEDAGQAPPPKSALPPCKGGIAGRIARAAGLCQ